MNKKDQPHHVPDCTCPYKQSNDGKCHKDCLVFKSYIERKKREQVPSNS